MVQRTQICLGKESDATVWFFKVVYYILNRPNFKKYNIKQLDQALLDGTAQPYNSAQYKDKRLHSTPAKIKKSDQSKFQ